MPSQLKLYTFPPSLYASIPRLLIAEKAIKDIEYVTVDLSKAENFSPEFLKKNPKHTVPTLEFVDENGNVVLETDSTIVCKQLDEISGAPHLYSPSNAADIDAYVNDMHENADVGNGLFFTSGNAAELAKKKDLIVSFLEGRVRGWETYSQQAPEYQALYDTQLQATRGMLAQYTGQADPSPMFDANARMWRQAVAFLDKTELLLKDKDYIFGEYSLADVHLTAWLYRQHLVRGQENFQGRPAVAAYYERVKARPSFKETWGHRNIMESLDYLLQDPNSPLTRVDMKTALSQDIFEKLQVDAMESLGELLPPADLFFVRVKQDNQKGDRAEVITPQSIDEVNQLLKDPWCLAHISSRMLENSDYRTQVEDYMILLGEGYYLPEDEDVQEAPPSPTEAKRKRKRKNSIEGLANTFKDDNYEHYWGERLQMQPKKRGRGRKQPQ